MVKHTSCPSCRSTNNRVVWDDGSSWCFTPGCSYNKNTHPGLSQYPLARGIQSKGITELTCEIYNVQYTFCYNNPTLVYRFYDKQMKERGVKYRYGGFYNDGTERKVWMRPTFIGYYGTHVQPNKDVCYLVEGENDVLAVAQAFKYTQTVFGVPGGDTLLKCHENNPILTSFSKIVLVPDQDSAGQVLLQHLLTFVPPHHIWVVTLPVKDSCLCIVQESEEKLLECLTTPVQYEKPPILSGSDLVTELEQWLGASNKGMGEDTGLLALNEMIGGWLPNSITLLAAFTKSGKTTLACQLALLYKKHTLFLSLEMSVSETALTMCQIVLGERFVGKESSIEQFKDVLNWIGTKIHIVKHTGYIAPKELENIVKLGVEELGISFLVIDHITIAATSTEEGQSVKSTEILFMTLKQLVNKYNLPCLAVCQVNETRDRITSRDIRGSAAQKQIASNVLAIERVGSGATVYTLEPCRHTGFTGMFPLMFNGTAFYEVNHGYSS